MPEGSSDYLMLGEEIFSSPRTPSLNLGSLATPELFYSSAVGRCSYNYAREPKVP